MVRTADDDEVRDEKVPFAATHRRCAELSRRFGAAHWYLESANGGCWDESGWCVAEDDEPLDTHEHQEEEKSGWEFGALDVAWRLSVSPEAIGPHTTVEGTAVLAVPAGKPDGWRYGALPI